MVHKFSKTFLGYHPQPTNRNVLVNSFFMPNNEHTLLRPCGKNKPTLIYSGVPTNFVWGGFNKFSWGQRTERKGIWRAAAP